MVAVFKTMTLDLSGVPDDRKKAAKRDALNVIENETTRALSKGRSPVKGEVFIKLNQDYATLEKQGDRTPNLQLEGDMLAAIEYNDLPGDNIGWGYTNDNAQSEKADGHNQFSPSSQKPIWDNGNKKLPKRRYIPGPSQELKPSSMKLVRAAVDKHRVKNKQREEDLDLDFAADSEFASVDVGGGLFSEETVVTQLVREFDRGKS